MSRSVKCGARPALRSMIRHSRVVVGTTFGAILFLTACTSPDPTAVSNSPDELGANDSAESPVTTRPPLVRETLVLGPLEPPVSFGLAEPGDGETESPNAETTASTEPEVPEPGSNESAESGGDESDDAGTDERSHAPPTAALTRARVDEISSALVAATGQTTSVSGSVQQLTAFPSGVPTPADSVITELSINTRVDPLQPDKAVVLDVRLNLTSSELPAAVVRLMQSSIPATGYAADRQSNGELLTGETFTSFSFTPIGGSLQETLTVVVVEPTEPTAEAASLVQITNTMISGDTNQLFTFADWAGEPSAVPAIGSLSAVSVGIQYGVFQDRPNRLFTASLTRFATNGSFTSVLEAIGEAFDTELQSTSSPVLLDVILFDGESAMLFVNEVTSDDRPGTSIGLQYQTNISTTANGADTDDPQDEESGTTP